MHIDHLLRILLTRASIIRLYFVLAFTHVLNGVTIRINTCMERNYIPIIFSISIYYEYESYFDIV